MGWNPNIYHLQVGYNPFTNHLLTSWDIQVGWNAYSQECVKENASWYVTSQQRGQVGYTRQPFSTSFCFCHDSVLIATTSPSRKTPKVISP